MNTEFKPATKRQTWALYCLTHKDYRSENLSAEQASNLIKELMEKKNIQPKAKKADKSIEDRLYEYLTTDDIFNECCGSLKYQSILEDDPAYLAPGEKQHQYAFIGVGCGITWLNIDKRSPKSIQLNEIKGEVLKRVRKNFIDRFSKEEQKYYESIGCPLEAIFCQDQHIQSVLYSNIVDFAKNELGIKNISYTSRLD